ncbi:MAG: GatB/YqeY domain-containing protein [bacterium]|nr:GatB/YqeY domain-containing protein [bacterium]
MSLQTQIKDEIKKAMLAKDTVRLNVMRGISSAFTNELVAKGQKPQDELADDAGIAVIKRLVKQRKDSIEQFTKGGREDLAADEKTELAVLETLLPASMPKEEIKKVAEAKKAELGITDIAKMGMLIGAVNKELKGAADGSDIKEVVESLFA